jgi:hypothetical protein
VVSATRFGPSSNDNKISPGKSPTSSMCCQMVHLARRSRTNGLLVTGCMLVSGGGQISSRSLARYRKIAKRLWLVAQGLQPQPIASARWRLGFEAGVHLSPWSGAGVWLHQRRSGTVAATCPSHRAMGPACLSAPDPSRSSENRTVPGGIASSMVLYLSPGTCKNGFEIPPKYDNPRIFPRWRSFDVG